MAEPQPHGMEPQTPSHPGLPCTLKGMSKPTRSLGGCEQHLALHHASKNESWTQVGMIAPIPGYKMMPSFPLKINSSDIPTSLPWLSPNTWKYSFHPNYFNYKNEICLGRKKCSSIGSMVHPRATPTVFFTIPPQLPSLVQLSASVCWMNTLPQKAKMNCSVKATHHLVGFIYLWFIKTAYKSAFGSLLWQNCLQQATLLTHHLHGCLQPSSPPGSQNPEHKNSRKLPHTPSVTGWSQKTLVGKISDPWHPKQTTGQRHTVAK
jgi:hypothetical protein